MNEQALVKQAQAGDREAFKGLVEMYAGVTERAARVLLPSREWAEDAVQEAWLDAWRGLPHFETGRPFRPWLLTIVANRCRMEARKDRSRPQGVPLSDGLSDSLGGIEDAGGEWDGELEEALKGLDEEQQRILALRYYADLKLEEIADMTGMPLGTVKSRLHRALGALRARLLEQLANTQEGKLR